MKKLSIILASVLVVLFALGAFTAFAETVPAVTEPVATSPVTDPVVTNPAEVSTTAPSEDVTSPTDATDPTGATEAPTEVTEPVTDFVRPTEYDENNQPNTYSDYVSPAPVYTPAEQNFDKNEWEEIELDVDSNSAGVGDFSAIKNNNSTGDEKSPLLLIMCIVFWCLALSCLTFVLLYKPKTGAKKAVAVKADGGKSVRRTEPKVSDDYNDGF